MLRERRRRATAPPLVSTAHPTSVENRQTLLAELLTQVEDMLDQIELAGIDGDDELVRLTSGFRGALTAACT